MRAMATSAAPATATRRFGELLRRWRSTRRLSQLALAAEAEICFFPGDEATEALAHRLAVSP